MRQGEEFRFVIDIDVIDIDLFVSIATAMVEISNDEPGTLLYDWYLDRDASKAKLYEAYDSIESLIAHMKGRVFSELGPKMRDAATFTHIDAFGDFPEVMKAGRVMAPTTWWGVPFAGVDGPG